MFVNGKPLDYSFMHLGGLYESIVEATIEACRRFGADKAMGIISSAIYEEHNFGSLEFEEFVSEEYGIELSNEDLDFLAAVVQARQMIEQTTEKIQEACHGR